LAVADTNLPAIQVYDVGAGIRLRQFVVGSVKSAQLSPTDDLLALSTSAHQVELWDWPNGALLWQSQRFPERPVWIKFTPDGQTILVDTGNRTVRMFDRASGEIVGELSQHRAEIECMTISPDARTIATTDSESLNLWHANSGQILFSFQAERKGEFSNVSFSPDGAWLAYRAKLNEVHLLPMHP
jgi:WD40 repeat protein